MNRAAQQQRDVLSMSSDSSQRQFLTFMLDEEEYGVDILKVQEIRGWEKVRPLPDTPDYICGVMNLRGEILPIVDLRKRFRLEPREYTSTTVVIIVRVGEGDEHRAIGIVVDAVSEVYTIKKSEMKPAPRLGGAISSELIYGMVMVDEQMVFLLNLERLVKESVLQEVDTITEDVVADED